jgi:hypothetical protein
MRLAALAVLLLVAGCQPLPQPFADDRPPPGSPLLTLKDGAGIKVEPVVGAGGEAGPRLAEAMAAALRDRDVPASTEAENRAGYRLVGTVVEKTLPGGRAAVDIAWELLGPDGARAGASTQHAEAPAAAWRGGDEGVLAEIAKSGAPTIAALVQEEAPIEAPGATAPPTVAVREVEGAPGDGSRSLTRAMVAALKQAKFGIAGETAAGAPAADKAFVVAGRVDVTRPVDGKQQVKIVWSVRNAAGGEIGKVNQENAVPAGALDGSWGDVAYAVATAASDGIVAILQKARELPPS